MSSIFLKPHLLGLLAGIFLLPAVLNPVTAGVVA